MTEPRSWDTLGATEPGAFDRLLSDTCCPAPAEALLAIAAEFRAVDGARASFRLDEHARSLFAVAAKGDPGDSARGLAALLTDRLRLRRDESSLEGLWIDRMLERRAGHPLALAVIAAEIGRRAGLKVGICSTACGWYAGIGEPERLWLIDPATDPGSTPTGPGALPLWPRGRLRGAHGHLRAARARRRRRRSPPRGSAPRPAPGRAPRVLDSVLVPE